MRRETKLKRPSHTAIAVITVLITFGLVAVGYNTVFFDFYTHKIMPYKVGEDRLPQEISYEPFTGKLFDLEREQIDHIQIYWLANSIDISSEDYLDSFVNSLNALRCHLWTPAPNYRRRNPPMLLTIYFRTIVPVKYGEPPLIRLGIYGSRIGISSAFFYCGHELYDNVIALWGECGGEPYL